MRFREDPKQSLELIAKACRVVLSRRISRFEQFILKRIEKIRTRVQSFLNPCKAIVIHTEHEFAWWTYKPFVRTYCETLHKLVEKLAELADRVKLSSDCLIVLEIHPGFICEDNVHVYKSSFIDSLIEVASCFYDSVKCNLKSSNVVITIEPRGGSIYIHSRQLIPDYSILLLLLELMEKIARGLSFGITLDLYQLAIALRVLAERAPGRVSRRLLCLTDLDCVVLGYVEKYILADNELLSRVVSVHAHWNHVYSPDNVKHERYRETVERYR